MSTNDKKLPEIMKGWENAPGHCHKEIGIWDWDNGDKAGTVCELCKRWNTYSALTKQLAATKAECERLQNKIDTSYEEVVENLKEAIDDSQACVDELEAKLARLQGKVDVTLSIADEALLWCEEMLKARDEMNSKVHCAPVRLSPITERVMQARQALAEFKKDKP